MAKIEATNDFVFVKRDAAAEESSGLYIPSSGRQKLNVGTVITLGDTIQDKKIKKSQGKKCLWHGTVGFEVEYDNEVYLVLSAGHIIGIV